MLHFRLVIACRTMKTTFAHLAVAVLMLAASGMNLQAGDHGLAVGARYHQEHSVFEELPFEDGDIAYGLAYEYHENNAYWQLAVNVAPDINGTNALEYVITPQINLIATDNMWRAGVGVLASYLMPEDDAVDEDWTDIYWQLMVGLVFPIGAMNLEVQAFYVLEAWDEITEFDFSDIEYGAWLGYRF